MQFDAVKLYNSIDFLDAVNVLWVIQSKARFTLFGRRVIRKNKLIRKLGKEFIRVR